MIVIRRVKVLWVQKVAAVGGAESLILNSAKLLNHDQFELTCVFVQNADSAYVAELEALGVRCIDLSEKRGGLIRRLVTLSALVLRDNWDIVHIHSPLPGSFARLGALFRRTNRPILITTEHNTWGSFNPLTRVINALTMRLDDHVLAVSEETMLSLSPNVRAKAEIAIQGVPLDDLRLRRIEGENRLEWDCPAETPILVTVANFRPQKDHRTLLAAFRQLVDRKVEFHSLLAGVGPSRDFVASEINRLGLAEHVQILGGRKDVPEILASSDLFVLSSVKEGLPVAIMESLAMGVPVVSTAVGGIPQAVHGTGAAKLVEPGNPTALASAIECILGDKTLRREMADAASLAAGRFDLLKVVRRLEALYIRLLDESDS